MTTATTAMTLRTVLADYPHTAPLKRGEVKSAGVKLDLIEIKPTFKAFKSMVRGLEYDVCELAIITYLQAKAYGKPLVLLPAVMLGRFQHHCMLYNSERGTLTPSDLVGRRVGLRAYTQTTGAWLRGLLQNDYGVDIGRVKWVTFEDAHVPEYRDPPGVERMSEDKNITKMLLDGELDAAIYGQELPNDPRLKSVIPQPELAAQEWFRKYHLAPINHMVVVKEALARSHPQAVREVYDLLVRAKQAAGGAAADFDPVPFGIAANRPALQLIIDYAVQQQLIPRRLTVDELFDDATRAFAA